MEFYIWLLFICTALILLILSIILIASIPISSLLNPEPKQDHELKQDQVPKEKPNRERMDLVFMRITSRDGIFAPTAFVYDRLDPNGSKLNTLFLGRAYDTSVQQGIAGIEIIVGGRGIPEVNGVPYP
jgi:hypothetical protein